MEFDWTRAVERNLDDLLRIVARLFLMAGIRTGRSLVLLPRGLRARILSVLRPAEFAARRLVVMAAFGLRREVRLVIRPADGRDGQPSGPATGPGNAEAAPSPVTLGTVPEGTEAAPSPVILGLEPRTHSVNAAPAPASKNTPLTVVIRDDVPDARKGPAATGDGGGRGDPAPSEAELLDLFRDRPCFALFDPWKRYAPFLIDADGPDYPFGGDFTEYGEDDDWPDADPGELVDARALSRRIRALALALDDLDGQAARLARWKARFAHAIERIRLADAGRIDGVTPDAVRRPAPWRFAPLRPGLPPGWRRRPRTDAETVLKECHGLALCAWNTS